MQKYLNVMYIPYIHETIKGNKPCESIHSTIAEKAAYAWLRTDKRA
jgi:hypothetical protein